MPALPNIKAGSSGYSYKEWKGPFYPEDLPASQMLAWYAQHLPTVEINNTFYRMPKENVVATWRDSVPEGFTFVVKASRRITHFARLKDAADPVGFLFATVDVLGEALGPVLFQLPPNFKKDTARLAAFLRELPPRRRVAFEFRHDSWMEEDALALLRDHGAAVCFADTDEGEDPPLLSTADWGYLRLRREAYDDEALRRWLSRLGETRWQEAYVFFKHEDGGAAPRTALRLIELAGA